MKSMTSCLLAVFVVVVAPLASAVIINIPDDYPTIQQGINASTDGDTVLVAPGVYIGNIVITNKNILLTSAEGPTDTQIKGLTEILEGVDATCVIRGFTITPDSTDPWFDYHPLITIEYGSPLIEGNIITGGGGFNSYVGGGIAVLYSDAIIRSNVIRNNHAGHGAGITAGGNTVTIEQNIISGNSAIGHDVATGGGILLRAGIIRYNLIIDNQASSLYREGGGIQAYGPVLTIRYIYNNTIVGNSAGDGGGLHFYIPEEAEDVLYKNNIIAFNPYGGGVHVVSPYSDSTNWDYNLIFGNEDYDYEGIIPGEHDIQEDPLFVDRFSGDYHLLPNSPCIDAGDPDFPLDPDSTRADIGAYYFDQTVGIDDPGEPSGPYQFRLHQNYPNPFNSQTIISYYLSEESIVSLHIYSITGHFVTAITNKKAQASGEHKYVWDGKDKNGKMVSTGIYFYELYVDDYRESKAMIMIK